ncbi:Defensin J1-2 [Zostera marina]|uniref:Defensin J1-2 n=1 Tax=Zostera marina TaxID=29655 RepID=A0A0K9P7Z7_ZOSMR|nr:Defensin J1-2 [Zostera marina]
MVKLQVFSAIIFTILFMIVISEMNVKVAEATICESHSATFRGRCWGATNNCDNVCKSEGFESGFCKGTIRTHCVCRKECDNGGGGGGGGGGGNGGNDGGNGGGNDYGNDGSVLFF